jgi:very-short-patch-repair endonuclease
MATLAQRLRKDPTVAEVRFWRLIEPLRRQGHHFRKQVALGPYVADFACHHDKIIVEIDGDSHYTDHGLAKDAVRTAYMESQGYRVVRFTNTDVMANPDGVYEFLMLALDKGTPTLPSPQGGG